MIDRNKHFPVGHFGGHWAIGHWPRLEALVRYVRSLLLTHSPAVVVQQWVDDLGLGWMTYVSHMPDGAGQDNVLCLYDSGVRIHSKDRNASVHEHFIVGMRLRATRFDVGAPRLDELVRYLNLIKDVTVIVGTRTYEVVTASMVGYLFIGYDDQRRSTFDLSYAFNMYEVVRL